MSRATQLRTIPWVLGLVLLVGSLVGANRLLSHPDAPTLSGSAKAPEPGGMVVLGTVDSDPSPIPVGPPAVAPMATIAKVYVHEGSVVKPGDVLVQFDDSLFRPKLDQANAELRAALEDVTKADIAKQAHAIDVERQTLAVKTAEADLTEAKNVYSIASDLFESVLKAEKNFATGAALTESEKERRRRENLELRKAAFLVTSAQAKFTDEQKKLAALQLVPLDATAKQAIEKVNRLKATVAEAQAAIDACVVKVRDEAGGVVESVTAVPGMTYGPSTRAPLMWLIPTGKRIVRAEVEAEFASKIVDKLGKKVMVFDHNNFSLSYEGVVVRIGTAFLPKRTSGETISMNPTRVLECVIEVSDPSPSGKPPLRVGQPVRVAFP